MQSTVSEENLWVTIFIVIMQMEISVAVMQVVYSAAHYALDWVFFAVDSFFYSYSGDRSNNSFLFLSLTDSFFS